MWPILERRTWLGVAAACTVLFVVAGCGSGGSSSSGSSGGSAKGKKVIFVTCPASNPNCNVLNQNVVKGIERSGAKVTTLESNFDAALQVQQLNHAIAQKPDLIVLEAIDTKSVAPSIRKAKAAGVPLINMDGPADPSVAAQTTAQILPDNKQLGRFAGQNIVDGLKAEGRKKANVVAITGTKASLITSDRMKGFNAVLAKTPQYKVVAVEDGDWDAVKSGKIAQELLAKYGSSGGIQGAYGMADYQAVPIIQAAKQAGVKVGVKNNGLIVTGSNCTKAGVVAVRKGDMFGSGTEDPVTQGLETGSWIAKYLEGKQIPKLVVLPQDRITKQTVDKYFKDCSSS